MKQFLIKVPQWLFTVVTAIAILYLTLVPKPLPDTDIPLWEHSDKIVHAIMFGGMYFVIYLDYVRKYGQDKWKATATWSIVVAVALFGGLIEIAQDSMGMGRGGDIYDFAADVAGVILASLVSPAIVSKMLR